MWNWTSGEDRPAWLVRFDNWLFPTAKRICDKHYYRPTIPTQIGMTILVRLMWVRAWLMLMKSKALQRNP